MNEYCQNKLLEYTKDEEEKRTININNCDYTIYKRNA